MFEKSLTGDNRKVVIFVGALIGLAILTRFLPHPANFTALGAVALFGAVYLPKKYALAVPFIAMVLSDLVIGLHNLVLFTWGSFLLVALMGLWLKKNKSVKNIILVAISASTLFFIITNFAVWAFTPLYTKDFAGLMSCYVAAVPFYRNMLAGDLFYVGLLFGLYEFFSVKYFVKKQASV